MLTDRRNIDINKKIINEFFNLLSTKDYQNLISLFSHDAIIKEPFSKDGKIMGNDSLKEFFKIMGTASTGLDHSFSYEKVFPENISIISEYKRGNKIKARFDFSFRNRSQVDKYSNKITELKIMFI